MSQNVTLALDIETLVELTPDDAAKVNGGYASVSSANPFAGGGGGGAVSSALPPQHQPKKRKHHHHVQTVSSAKPF